MDEAEPSDTIGLHDFVKTLRPEEAAIVQAARKRRVEEEKTIRNIFRSPVRPRYEETRPPVDAVVRACLRVMASDLITLVTAGHCELWQNGNRVPSSFGRDSEAGEAIQRALWQDDGEGFRVLRTRSNHAKSDPGFATPTDEEVLVWMGKEQAGRAPGERGRDELIKAASKKFKISGKYIRSIWDENRSARAKWPAAKANAKKIRPRFSVDGGVPWKIHPRSPCSNTASLLHALGSNAATGGN